MLKGINPLLNADVLQALRAMGHGDDLIIADTNFPSDSVARQTRLGKLLRIDASAAEVVKAVIGDRTEGFLFLKRDRYVIDYQNWRREVWVKAVKRSGLGSVRLHDMRHTFASHALQNGATLAEVGQMLGHSSPQTTQRYAKLSDDYSDRVRGSLPIDPRGENVGN